MIESTIIALREGIEIALVIGILIVYLQKTERSFLTPAVYVGLILAIIASIGGAMLLEKFAIDNESLEGYFELVAAVFVISMIVWMWRTAKYIRKEIEEKINSITQTSASWKMRIGIAGFTFLMIVREGLEAAIFLQAVAFNTGEWLGMLGTIIGISLATVFAVLFIRGSVKIDIARFLKVTAVTLIIFSLQLIINAIHEFYEYGILPASPKMMGILGPIVQHEIFFITAIISIPAIMLLIPGKKSSPSFSMDRRWQISACIAGIGIIFFLGMGDIFSSNHDMSLSSEPISPLPSNGIIQIPLSNVGDGHLHRYSIDDNGLEIRFFVLRTGLGKFATAFDACYACYSYGHYYLKNGELICSQCDAPSPLSKLHPSLEEEPDSTNTGSMEGNGCAPIYLPSKIDNGFVLVKIADLQKKRKYFDISPTP